GERRPITIDIISVDVVILRAPAFAMDEALDCARALCGMKADGSPLPSERDLNVLLSSNADDRWVLKIANGADDRALLEAQNAAMEHVGRRTALCQRVIPALTGETIAVV